MTWISDALVCHLIDTKLVTDVAVHSTLRRLVCSSITICRCQGLTVVVSSSWPWRKRRASLTASSGWRRQRPMEPNDDSEVRSTSLPMHHGPPPRQQGRPLPHRRTGDGKQPDLDKMRREKRSKEGSGPTHGLDAKPRQHATKKLKKAQLPVFVLDRSRVCFLLQIGQT